MRLCTFDDWEILEIKLKELTKSKGNLLHEDGKVKECCKANHRDSWEDSLADTRIHISCQQTMVSVKLKLMYGATWYLYYFVINHVQNRFIWKLSILKKHLFDYGQPSKQVSNGYLFNLLKIHSAPRIFKIMYDFLDFPTWNRRQCNVVGVVVVIPVYRIKTSCDQ